MIQLTVEQGGCGQSVVDRRVDRTGNRVVGAAVWLTDIRQGKPIPLERRFELENEDCVMVPRLQTVVTGGTLNVLSADIVMHRNKIVDVATGEVVGIAPFNDNGQVVPFDQLFKKTAQLEVVDELHPWEQGEPHCARPPVLRGVGEVGGFCDRRIPPGTYHLRAWHPAARVCGSGGDRQFRRTGHCGDEAPGTAAAAGVSPAPPATPESLRSDTAAR